jgi:HlyD family secretion protein
VKKWILIAVLVLGAGGAAAWYFGFRSAAAVEAAPTLAKVERGPIKVVVASTGRVVSNLDVDIKCKASGEIIKLPFDVSASVKEGDLLVELDPVDMERVVHQAEVELSASKARQTSAEENLAMAERTLVTDHQKAEAALKSAQSRAKDARAKADRMKPLLDKGLCSQEDFDTAETAAVQAAADLSNAVIKEEELKTQEKALEIKRQDVELAKAAVEADKIARDIAKDRLTDTKVLSPMDGVVAARNVQKGQIIASGVSNVGGGTTVLTLSDLSRLFVVAAVDETDIGKVKLKQSVTITADAFRGKKFKGSVVQIATRGVNASNVVTFEVKIEVTSENKGLLKPEMTANVEILADSKDDVLQVPVEAVVRKNGGKQYVTVARDGGAKEEVEVTTGLSDGNKIEVASGLAEGDSVALGKGGADSRWSGQKNTPRPGGPPMGMPMGGKR